MQISRQHKNVYKLYAWARTQECLDAYRIKYENRVRHWNALRAEWTCHSFVPVPRSYFYAALRSKANGLFHPNAE